MQPSQAVVSNRTNVICTTNIQFRFDGMQPISLIYTEIVHDQIHLAYQIVYILLTIFC